MPGAGATAASAQPAEPALKAYERSRTLAARDAVVLEHAHLATSLAAEMTRKPDQRGDLQQVGYLGLLKAVERFDSSLQVPFTAYARTVIAGEIAHYLRDKVDALRVPRWYRALSRRLDAACDTLAGRLQRTPTTGELAAELNLSPAGVCEIFALRGRYRTQTLDDTGRGDEVQVEVLRSTRKVSFQLPVEDRIVLDRALEKLVAFERSIVHLFFYMDLSHGEIAARLGLSRRHIARAMPKVLARLKSELRQR
ncbi:MAG: sigma-70 family RNA polymerase sigma factor [Candidatus Eremiobacteraeota bacterium]|nr:sigma-70 family RNA polymerase sigma factor [Candidatus Eremiobacteraeota bacterium]